jgi:hypothetical protein
LVPAVPAVGPGCTPASGVALGCASAELASVGGCAGGSCRSALVPPAPLGDAPPPLQAMESAQSSERLQRAFSDSNVTFL